MDKKDKAALYYLLGFTSGPFVAALPFGVVMSIDKYFIHPNKDFWNNQDVTPEEMVLVGLGALFTVFFAVRGYAKNSAAD